MQRIHIIDSHTGGEPTRVVYNGGPAHGGLSPRGCLESLRADHDGFRRLVINEPRGSDILVGAILCPTTDPHADAGVVFFNNVGYLGMCGHGMIGLVVTLGYVQQLNRSPTGEYLIQTPVGNVPVQYDGQNTVSLENVPSYRLAKQVKVDVPGVGVIAGDIAWGGNWFFLVSEHGQDLSQQNAEALTDFTWRIRLALQQQGITGKDGALIDHIELFGPPRDPANDSRNFVLCPGKSYDRSPCGTGTSAKLACLVADGKLAPGESWKQESITGSVFVGQVRCEGELIFPRITGQAFITAEATLLIDPLDPLAEDCGL